MGVYISTGTDAGIVSCKVGTNGSQVVMCGYLFAAYAVAGLPESKRVCAWVAPGWAHNNILDANAPVPQRNRPKTVVDLIAYSTDDDGDGIAESGWCFSQDATIELGLKFKPVTCPVLRDLVTVWEQTALQGVAGNIDAATAARISDHLDTLIPLLEPSESWFEQMCDIAGVFHAAKQLHAPVRIG